MLKTERGGEGNTLLNSLNKAKDNLASVITEAVTQHGCAAQLFFIDREIKEKEKTHDVLMNELKSAFKNFNVLKFVRVCKELRETNKVMLKLTDEREILLASQLDISIYENGFLITVDEDDVDLFKSLFPKCELKRTLDSGEVVEKISSLKREIASDREHYNKVNGFLKDFDIDVIVDAFQKNKTSARFDLFIEKSNQFYEFLGTDRRLLPRDVEDIYLISSLTVRSRVVRILFTEIRELMIFTLSGFERKLTGYCKDLDCSFSGLSVS